MGPCGRRFPGYRVPPKGQVQVMIKNANQTAVKVFLVPYDMTDMPSGTKTVLRQRTYLLPSAGDIDPAADPKPTAGTFQSAVQLQFCSPPVPSRRRSSLSPATAIKHSPKVYLHKTIRVVFYPTALDSTQKFRTSTDYPMETTTAPSSPTPAASPSSSPSPASGRYASYAGPEEAWLKARKARARREAGLDEVDEVEDELTSPSPSAAKRVKNQRRKSLLSEWSSMREALDDDEEEALGGGQDDAGSTARLAVSLDEGIAAAVNGHPGAEFGWTSPPMTWGLSSTSSSTLTAAAPPDSPDSPSSRAKGPDPIKFERIASPPLHAVFGTAGSGLSSSRPGSRAGVREREEEDARKGSKGRGATTPTQARFFNWRAGVSSGRQVDDDEEERPGMGGIR